MNASLSRLGSTAEDYERIGISPDQVASWEDGARTDGSAGTFEWWYFDTHLDDGAKLVVVFFTKEFTAIDRHCRERGIQWFASCWDEEAVEAMERFDPPCTKAASPAAALV